MSKEPATPMLSKIHSVKDISQDLGEFLDYMSEEGYHLVEVLPARGSSHDIDTAYLVKDVWDDVREGRKCFLILTDTEMREFQEKVISGFGNAKTRKEFPKFIQFLEDKGIRIARETIVKLGVLSNVGINKTLAEYFEIDENAAEAERRAILEAIRT